MLSITLISEKDKLMPYFKDYKLFYSPAFYIYSATDKLEELAYGLFKIKSDQVEIIDFVSSDLSDHHLFDGILRAGFNYASENGLSVGVIPETFRSEFSTMFDNLNFPHQSVFDINNFFNKFKNCNMVL